VLSNVLYSLGIINLMGKAVEPVIVRLWGLNEMAVIPLMVGLLRKDIAIAMLAPLGLTTKQLVISCVILAVYFPCMASFIVLCKELGIKDLIKSTLLMILVALVIGALLNVALFKL